MLGEDPNSNLSVSKAYKKLRALEVHDEWLGWSQIWRLKVQHQAKVFVWLLAHDKLMTNLNKWKRKLVDFPKCEICHQQEESSLHTVRDCSDATKVWAHFLPPNLSSKFFFLIPQRLDFLEYFE